MKNDEQVHVREEPGLARVLGHVPDRVEVDQRADPRDDEDHRGAQGVEPEIRADPEPSHRDPVEQVLQREAALARIGQQVEHRGERHAERREHEDGREDARPLPQAVPQEHVDRRAGKRERRDQPQAAGDVRDERAYHRISRAASTSIVRRRR
jgi:hypothetical protein